MRRRVLLYTGLVAAAAALLLPFYWMTVSSLKRSNDVFTIPIRWWPDTVVWQNYLDIWQKSDMTGWLRNTLFLSVMVTFFQVLTGSFAAYGFSKVRFPGREVLFILVLLTLMIPDQLRLVPIFVMFTNWHLLGHYHGYVLIKLASAAQLFLMRQYFLTIPRDLEEAAKLDGAGYFKTFWRVMLPLAGPAIAALAILQFQGTWNDFFWPLILFGQGSEHLYTMQLGLAQLTLTYQTLWPQLMAGSLIAIAPILLIFLVFQRFFVSGVTAAGIKG